MKKSITVRASGDIGPGGRGRVITNKQADGRYKAVNHAESVTVTPCGAGKALNGCTPDR